MVHPARFELATPGSEDQCSNPLSYGCVLRGNFNISKHVFLGVVVCYSNDMKRNYLIGYKVFFGLLGFSAIITEIVTISARGLFSASDFFSYFTIEANTIAFIVFLVSASYLFARKKSAVVDFFRGASTFFMVVTGIVFAVLLAGIEGATLTAVPWDNIVLHYLIPIAVTLDWILDPPAQKISYQKALAWLIFPLAYLAYSLIRGPIVGWYPYPFLDPSNGGYGQVALTSVVILLGGLVLAYVVSRVGPGAKLHRKQ